MEVKKSDHAVDQVDGPQFHNFSENPFQQIKGRVKR